MEGSVLNRDVSFRSNIEIKKCKNKYTRVVNLLDALKPPLESHWLSIKVQEIRECGNKDEQEEMKRDVPVFSPSGIFEPSFGKSDFKQHSGLICLDIDKKDNLHINDWEKLKANLSALPFVAYISLSIRGNGLFVIVPILHTDQHGNHFDALSFFFLGLGLTLDPSCRNINRLRFYSIDNAPYINHFAKHFSQFLPGTIGTEVTTVNSLKKTGRIKCKDGEKLSPLDDYNKNGDSDAQSILINHGWKCIGKKGLNIEYLRPGKRSGLSAHYQVNYKKLFVFSSDSETGFPKASESGGFPYSNTDIKLHLERHQSISALAKVLKAEGWGN